MKSKLVCTLLLVTMFLFPGCYTILLVEPTDEDISYSPGPIMPYDPEPWPTTAPPPEPPPYPPPAPPVTYIPAPVYIIDNPPSVPPPSTEIHREIHTGRGPFVSNPAPERNDNNREMRDSGVQRSEHADSNPPPVRNEENNRPTRDSGSQRSRR